MTGRWLKFAVWTVAIVIVLLVAAFAVLRTPDTDRMAMIAKYGGPGAHFITAPDGARIHVRDTGTVGALDAAKPAMILLHGSNASLHTWEPLVARLRGQYRIITLDFPGHGLTGATPTDRYDPAEMMATVDTVAHAAGVRHFILGGNSMGGGIAWRYAVAHPQKVDALILIDAAGMPLRPGEKSAPSNIGFRLARSPIGGWLMQSITPRSLVRQSIVGTVADPAVVTEAMVDRYWELLRFPGNRAATAKRFARPLIDPVAAEQVRAISAPTLIIFGKQDPLINASAAQTFHERIAGSQVVLFDHVGHIPMEEAPDQTAEAIRDFLAGLSPPAQRGGHKVR